jgi:GTP-binding protein
MKKSMRNIAIIAHVDHGKTTLVDEILKQVDFFKDRKDAEECFMDSNDLERERGITILSKNISIEYKKTKINIIDTPGHSDFGGQVERVLNLADGVLLLVDAAEGPMPQTRFVLDKALKLNLKPVVIINKVDKPDSRIDEVHDKVFDLFVELNATDEQLDFPLLYASGKDGWAGKELDGPRDSIIPVLDAILEYIPSPTIQAGPVQMQIATLGYSEFVGRIGIGRIYRGTLDLKTPLTLIKNDGSSKSVKIKQLFTYVGLERKEVESVQCGDLCAIVGIEGIDIGDTITDSNAQEALPPIHLDEPTISMMFRVNNSPFYGKEGKFVSSRHLRERLFTETERDVALVVEEVDGDSFNVSGRGVLHLSILIENMRREGYEMTVSQPHVIYKTIDGIKQEPIELLDVDTPSETAGKVIELVGTRRGEMKSMETHGNRTLLEFMVPTRGIIGLRSKIMTASAGEAIVSHLYDHYEPCKGEIINRLNGVLISMGQGEAVAYAIDALQQRGTFFIPPGTPVYEGMIVAENCKDDDLVVNMQKSKQLTNVRSSSSDKAMKIAPPRTLSLEETLEYIADDELVEITPKSIRMRKRFLTEIDRKRNKSGKL